MCEVEYRPMSAFSDRALVAWMFLAVLFGTVSVMVLEASQRQIVMPVLNGLVSALVVMLLSRQFCRASGRLLRVRWLCLAAAVIWALASALWLGSYLITGQPAMMLIDLAFVIAYMPILAMVAAFMRPGIPRTDRVRLLLDVLVFIIGGGLILWDLARIWSPNVLNSAAYLLLDLAMLSTAVSLLALRHTTGLWPGMWMVLAAITVSVSGDALLVMGVAPHPVLDAGWLAVFVILQWAFFGCAMHLLPCHEPLVAVDAERLPRGRSVSLTIGLLMTILGVVVVVRPGSTHGIGELVAVVVLLLLVLVRSLADQGELRNLLSDLHRAQSELEQRVLERTRDFHLAATERETAVTAEAEQRKFSEALRDVVLAVASSDDLRTALQAVVAAVRRCGPIQASGIMFIEDGIATIVAHDGYVERGMGAWVEALSIPADAHSGFKRMYINGETVVQNQAQTLPEWQAVPEVSWVGSYLGVPLRAHGHTYGFINAVTEHAEAFTSVHAERLNAVAGSVALALENARLLARTRRRLERLGLLIEVGNGLNREVGEPTAALHEALWRFGQATDSSALMVCGGGEAHFWKPLATYGFDREFLDFSLSVPALEGSGLLANGWSLIRQPLDDLRLTDPRLDALRTLVEQRGQRMLVAVPLTIHEHRHGVLLAFAQRDLAAPEAEQLRLLGAIISARIEVDARLQAERHARGVAEEASRLKGEFLANTSHELRTPLTGILLSLELATDGSVIEAVDRDDLLATAHLSASRLLEMINGLLDLAKIEAGRLEIHPERLIIDQAVNKVVGQLRLSAERRDLVLQVAGWIEGDACAAWADPVAVHQIVTNLIGNALKFTERGGVVISFIARENRVVIRVADTGLGIAAQQLARLFQPFVQADGSSTRRFEGSGLGLVIARRMAESMGGSLTLRSDGPGCGSVAEIELPAVA